MSPSHRQSTARLSDSNLPAASFRPRRSPLLFLFVLGCLYLWTAREFGRRSASETIRFPLLGTDCEVTAVARRAQRPDALVGEVRGRMEAVERQCSAQRAGSVVYRLNRQPAGVPLRLAASEAWVLHLFDEARRVADLTSGSLDLTDAPLRSEWSFPPSRPRVPPPGALAAARARVDYRRIRIDLPGRSLTRLSDDVQVDLGLLAAAEAVDQAIRCLRERRVSGALVKAGDLFEVLGAKAPEQPWRAALPDPAHPAAPWPAAGFPAPPGTAFATVHFRQGAFEIDGRLCHANLDPHTGLPAEGLLSATVLDPSCVRAAALARALFVLGPEKALRLAEAHRIPALLTAPGFELRASSALPAPLRDLPPPQP